jgi:hypothetical protein
MMVMDDDDDNGEENIVILYFVSLIICLFCNSFILFTLQFQNGFRFQFGENIRWLNCAPHILRKAKTEKVSSRLTFAALQSLKLVYVLHFHAVIVWVYVRVTAIL